MIDFICREGTPEWLEERKNYLTASSAYTVLSGPDSPFSDKYRRESWWSSTTIDIVNDKFHDKPPVFNARSKKNMWWGSYDEATNMEAAQEITGIPMSRYQWLVSNPKWPHLACTPDGIAVPEMAVPMNLEPTSLPEQVNSCRGLALNSGGIGVIEMKNPGQPWKKRGGTHWIDIPPAYYSAQIQFHMHVLELDWGFLVGRFGGNDLSVHYFNYNPAFTSEMDYMNETMENWKDEYRVS